MLKKASKQRLNIFLLKDEATLDTAVQKDVAGTKFFPISEEFSFPGTIWVKSAPSKPPKWKSFLQEGTESNLTDIFTQTASALIALESNNRVFCITFGSARHWIEDEKIERRFGMLVTLNTVQYDKIRSVDREEFETITRMTRSQTSISSPIENFGLDVQRDLVRSVTGEPEDKSFATHVTGADNLILSIAIEFGDLAKKCAEALDHFKEEKYKVRYGWIDNFQRVQDKALIKSLEESLFESLQNQNSENIFLSPPILIDTQESHEFRYPSQKKTSMAYADLRFADLLKHFDRARLSIEWMKKHKIREFTVDTDTVVREFSVYDSVVFESSRENKLYALSQGEWYMIAQDYVTQVIQELSSIEDHPNLVLPDALPDENESVYNKRVFDESAGALAHLDRKMVMYGGGQSSVEICDLLSLDRNFIHVKAKTKSSALSHLFAQGLVSGQVMREPKFRELALKKCEETSHHHLFSNENFQPSEHDVTYAIITSAEIPIKNALPFFSKQSLVNAARELRNMGYKVWIKKIPIAKAN